MLRKILPVSSLSLLRIFLFPHHHPVCGVSVLGAKHRAAAQLQGLEQMGCFTAMLKPARQRKEQLRSHILPAELRTPLKSCSLASSSAWPREMWEDEWFRPRKWFAAGRLLVRAGCAPSLQSGCIIARDSFPTSCLPYLHHKTSRGLAETVRPQICNRKLLQVLGCLSPLQSSLWERKSLPEVVVVTDTCGAFLWFSGIHYKITAGWSSNTD